MPKIAAVFGSPRRGGNTAVLLRQAIKGARDSGAEVSEIVLRDLKMSPCLEVYGCQKTGECAIKDDFQGVVEQLSASQGIMLASPIFFYSVSAQTKILMDRCQSLWVKKYWIDKQSLSEHRYSRKGLFIAAGATKGKKLFEGALLTVRYFFDALDTELWRSCLYRGLDFANEVFDHPGYLEEVYRTGKELAALLAER